MSEKRFVIWDIDGALYNYHVLPDRGFDKLCDEANAQAACELLPILDHKEALRLGAESFELFHDCYGSFMPLAAQSGLSDTEFRQRLFKRYHVILFNMITEQHPDFFDDGGRTATAFQQSTGHLKHGTLSHSCMEGWGKRILDRMKILPYFEPKALLGLDQYGFQRKFESIVPIKMALEKLEADPARSFFIEDSVHNLEPAAEIKGLQLIYIYNNMPLDVLPSFVAHQFATPADCLNYIRDNETNGRIV